MAIEVKAGIDVVDEQRLTEALNEFARAMAEKLREKVLEGRRGWNDPQWLTQEWSYAFREHIAEAEERGWSANALVDVANFAMFKWWAHREWLRGMAEHEANVHPQA